MYSKHWDRLSAAVFLLFLIVYVLLAWFSSQDATHLTFSSIQGYRIFNIDDAYRRYLAGMPFLSGGIWVWTFYLPANFLFDGFFSWLTNHSQFWMRVPHLLAYLGGMWLVYRAGRHIKIAPGWMLLSCITLLWMPLAALVSMSFYGESLLGALMGVVIYALATNRSRLLVVGAAVMPFIRPGGAFYLGLLVLHRLWQRRFKQAIVMMLPAWGYFIVIMVVFDFSWSAYFQDRAAYGTIYNQVALHGALENQAWLPFYTINPLWWIAGLAGGLLPSMRRFRPLYFGAVLLVLVLFKQMAFGHAQGEARYYFSMFPLFALYQGALLHAITQKWSKKGVTAACFAVFLCIGAENSLQLDPLRNNYFDGNRYPLGKTTAGLDDFVVLPDGYSTILKQAYAFTCAYAKYDPSVDKVIVNSFHWFNKSAVCNLPKRVRVELSFAKPSTAYSDMRGYFYSMYPALPHYSFYHFFSAPNKRVEDGNHYALYVTMHDRVFPGNAIQPLFTNQVFNVYKVRYRAYQETPFFRVGE